MSQKVDVNPEELRRFVNNLRRANQNIKDQQGQLRGSFSRLGETWRDSEFRRFEDNFKEAMKALDKFLHSSEEHIPRLLNKAKAADEFLRLR